MEMNQARASVGIWGQVSWSEWASKCQDEMLRGTAGGEVGE